MPGEIKEEFMSKIKEQFNIARILDKFVLNIIGIQLKVYNRADLFCNLYSIYDIYV